MRANAANQARLAPRIVFVVNHAAFFVSHRLPIAKEAIRRGWDVTLVTGQPGSSSMEREAICVLQRENISHRRVAFGSSTINPFRELLGLVQLTYVLWRIAPDLVHCASPKGVLYGGIAARAARIRCLVLAISGMGYAYVDSEKISSLRPLVRALYGRLISTALAHPHKRVVVQNRDDERLMGGELSVSGEELVLVPGSGVDLGKFIPGPIEKREPLVVLPARMLRDKGVLEFAEAARIVREKYPDWKFVLAGTADYLNPEALSQEEIVALVRAGYVEWMGHVDDMHSLLARTSIVCLPSYREGMPKSLLEAAAAGCAIVTTDVPGCREAVEIGKTGDLVPARDAKELASALVTLIQDPSRIAAYGRCGRKLAERRFGIEVIVSQIFLVYGQLLALEPWVRK